MRTTSRGPRRLSLTAGILTATGSVACVALYLGVSGTVQQGQQVTQLASLRDKQIATAQTALGVRADHIDATLQGLSVQNLKTSGTNLEQVSISQAAEEEANRKVGEGMKFLTGNASAGLQPLIIDMQKQLDAIAATYTIGADSTPVEIQQSIDDYQVAEAAFTEDVTTLISASQQEVDDEVAAASTRADHAKLLTIGALGLGLLVAAGITAVVVRATRQDSKVIADTALRLRAGDLTQTSGVMRRDELGVIASALDTAIEDLRTQIVAVSRGADALGGAANLLTGTSQQAEIASERTVREVGVVGGDTAVVTQSLQSITAGSQEMGAAIREISMSAAEATGVAAEAVRVAEQANGTVTRLGQSSVEIGNVMKVITAIAEQTNLLALNATIEAARAGELGKGFAVVAGEVKELAQQTARATEDIARRVGAIQEDAGEAVLAIASITGVISTINNLQTTIASAVEEQTATTSEMARAIEEARDSVDRIAAGIGEVTATTEATGRSVVETREAADGVDAVSQDLRSVVARFTLH